MSVLLDRIMEGSMVLLIIGIFLAFASSLSVARGRDSYFSLVIFGFLSCLLIPLFLSGLLLVLSFVLFCVFA